MSFDAIKKHEPSLRSISRDLSGEELAVGSHRMELIFGTERP
jgi:hypothetical protein